jgi:CubicO group peptidase (beta-lactamase class C family)
MSDTIAWAKPEDVGMSRERLGRIAEVLAADVASGRVPGAVTLVARHGRIVHFKAHGLRDPADPAASPMERDTIFRIYSMTKPVVSVALMMLAEAGRLTLADPLSEFIPEFRTMQVLREIGGREEVLPARNPITIHDLLRHTSGLTYDWMRDGPVERLYADARAGRRDRTNADQALALAELPLAAEPGTEWNYSRSTDVIGRVIEIVSGRPLGEHLAEAVFGPLGMLETGFHVPEDLHGRIAEPFSTDPDTGEAVGVLDVRRPPPLESGGGGLVSTAPDYARFLHMIASGGVLDGARLLGSRTLASMMSDHLAPGMPINGDLMMPGYGFGLGFAVRRATGLAPVPGSAGDGYWEGLGGTSFWVDPAEGLYAVIMVQAPGRRAHYRRLFRQLVYAAVLE